MGTQRRFEGSTLATVLAKVQKEVGADAKIISAQRSRTGGVMGFFQKEKFEVIVDIPDGTETAVSVGSAPNLELNDMPSPTSLMDLVEKISRAEAASDAQPEAPAPVAQPVAKVKKVEPAPRRRINTPSRSGAPDLQITLPPPAPSTLVQNDEDDEDEFGNVEAEEIDAEETEAPLRHAQVIKAERVERDKGQERPISTESKNFAEVLSRVAYQADMKSDPQVKEGAPVIDLDTDANEKATIDGRPAYLDVRPSDAPAQVVPPFRTRISDHPLTTLGLPTPYIPKDSDPAHLQDALTAALAHLPQAPTVRPGKGSIIAVVGEIVEALELAEELAERWKRPTEEIVLASQQYRGRGSNTVLRNVRNADDARRSWSRRPRPTIVAIDAFPGSRDTAWAEHILTALEPIATYGVADATRKAEDIAVWASQLGGVDALAVNHLEETVSPASVLSTGIPVERIEGRPATAQYWAILLTERLNAI